MPDRKSDVVEAAKLYFDLHDTVEYQDGIIVNGEATVTPPPFRADMKYRLHRAHLPYESKMRNVRCTIF